MTTKQITELERELLNKLDSDDWMSNYNDIDNLRAKILAENIPSSLIKKLKKNAEDLNSKIREQNSIIREFLDIQDNRLMVDVIRSIIYPREIFHG